MGISAKRMPIPGSSSADAAAVQTVPYPPKAVSVGPGVVGSKLVPRPPGTPPPPGASSADSAAHGPRPPGYPPPDQDDEVEVDEEDEDAEGGENADDDGWNGWVTWEEGAEDDAEDEKAWWEQGDEGDWRKKRSREWGDEQDWTAEEWSEWQKTKDTENDEWLSWKARTHRQRWRGRDQDDDEEEEEDEEAEEQRPAEETRKSRRKGKGKGKGKGGKNDYINGDEEDLPEKFGDTWEEPREDTGLPLIGEAAPARAKWQYILADESRRCFMGYLPSAIPDAKCKMFFKKIKVGTKWLQPKGTNGQIPRKTAWFTKKGCSCTYQYGGLWVKAQEFPPYMHELLREVMPLCGINSEADWPDGCNLNLYDDGGKSVGWHADDERLFQGKFRDIQIISLSFGQQRKFELRTNWPERGEKRLHKVWVKSGDLLTMEGMTQKHFQHRVPKERHSEGARINLTWRWVLKHTPKCASVRNRLF